MKARKDAVFTKWSRANFGARHGNQAVARAVQPISELTSLADIWGIVPRYTGKIIRRRGIAMIAVVA